MPKQKLRVQQARLVTTFCLLECLQGDAGTCSRVLPVHREAQRC